MQVTSAPEAALRIAIVDRLDDIGADEWNALGAAGYPFLRHEFLSALEEEDCLGERYGWLPRHVTLRSDDGRLLGAAPLYLKFNSYGEFVFDWSWADAYARHGLQYYPKLVSASPYTPATGPKLLIHPDAPAETRPMLVEASRQLALELGVSSLHWLFTEPDENALLERDGFLRRVGCQFHWTNRDYADFDAFLATLTSGKRKNIRKERRKVEDAGVAFRLLDGHTASSRDWRVFHRYYESTFDRRGGIPTLSQRFFERIARTMPEQLLLVMCDLEGEPVAAAFCLVGEHTLYGRHWGCETHVDNLHFEACYYQGIEFCIRHGLQRFEPGAQGEHKIPRGFLPTETLSAHWLADARFSDAVSRHLELERSGMADYLAEMMQRSPYRAQDNC
jgi:hypothetical protein